MASVSIQKFAAEIDVCVKKAQQMVQSDVFIKNKISFDLSDCKPTKKGRCRKNKNWRINLVKYYDAIDKGLIHNAANY